VYVLNLYLEIGRKQTAKEMKVTIPKREACY